MTPNPNTSTQRTSKSKKKTSLKDVLKQATVMAKDKKKEKEQHQHSSWSSERGGGGGDVHIRQTGEKIKVLVCTANMGNQQPDTVSLNAWIPEDGLVRDVVTEPKYPMQRASIDKFQSAVNAALSKQSDHSTKRSNSKDSDDLNDDEPRRKFDIIVVGMQESTFEATKPVSETSLLPPALASYHGATTHMPPTKPKPPSRGASVIKQSIKAAKAVTQLASGGKDHIQKENKGIRRIASLDPTRKFHSDGSKPHKSMNSTLSGISGLSASHSTGRGGRTTPPRTYSGGSRVPPPPRASAEMDDDEEEGDLITPDTKRIDSGVITTVTESAGRAKDTEVLHQLFREQLPSYTQAISYQRGEMRLMLFYVEDQISLDVVSLKGQNTGRAGLANKGGIVAEVCVNETTRLAFLTAHLEAHEGEAKFETRIASLADILKGTASSTTAIRCDASSCSHFTFAMGDLNFRTKIPHIEAGSPEHIAAAHHLAKKEDWVTLNKYDELAMALRDKRCLVGFQTPLCWFPPTFKVTRDTSEYVYNDKRSPSYTDRILYKASHRLGDKIHPLVYEPVDEFISSDHKPIRGAFDIELNPKLKWRPTLVHGNRLISQKPKSRLGLGKNYKKSTLNLQAEPLGRIQNLHLYVSSISCKLNQPGSKDKDSAFPSPYVCFVSTPKQAIKKDVGTLDKFKRAVWLNARKQGKNEIDGSVARTELGWPRTRRLTNTYEPSWDDDEVHFKVRTHNKDGTPIDLTGAMMHISVFDGKNSASKLMGSFTLNLAYLIVRSRQRIPKAPKTKTSQRNLLDEQSSVSLRALQLLTKGVRRRAARRNSSTGRNLSQRPSEESKELSISPSLLQKKSPPAGGVASASAENTDGAHVKKSTFPITSESGEVKLRDNADDDYEHPYGETTSGPSDKLKLVMQSSWFSSAARKNMQMALRRGSFSTDGQRDVGGDGGTGTGNASSNRSNIRPSTTNSSSSSSGIGRNRKKIKKNSRRLLRNPSAIMNHLNIQCLRIYEPLLKNGKQVGMISCTIDFFWLDEAATATAATATSETATVPTATAAAAAATAASESATATAGNGNGSHHSASGGARRQQQQ